MTEEASQQAATPAAATSKTAPPAQPPSKNTTNTTTEAQKQQPSDPPSLANNPLPKRKTSLLHQRKRRSIYSVLMTMHRARGQGLQVGHLVVARLEGPRMGRRRRLRMMMISTIFRVLHLVLLQVQVLRVLVCLLRDLLQGWRVYSMRLCNLRRREELFPLLNLIIHLCRHSTCLLLHNHCDRLRRHNQHPRLALGWG